MQPPAFSTLPDILKFRAHTAPDQAAFHFEEKKYTYTWLLEESLDVAANLLATGIQKGDRVLIAIPNGPAFFPAFFGCMLAGAIAVPIFPGSSPERLAHYQQLCSSRLTLMPDLFEGEKSPTPNLLPSSDPDDIAFIQYTSGSTSDPKGVQLSHTNLLTNIRQLIAGMEITEKDVFVSWLPVYHDMGLILMTLVPFSLGLKLVLLPSTLHQVHPWLRAMEQHRGTFTAAPDIAYRLALKWRLADHLYDLSALRVALNASEPVRHTTILDFEKAFGLRNVMTAGYGLAEATVGVCMSAPGRSPVVDTDGHVSVGIPFPGVSIAILEHDQLAQTGIVGEILVKSTANTIGYFQNPEGTLALHWENGYLRTGDIGYLDTEGQLFILGRTKQLIKVGGRSFYAADLEESIDVLPQVRHAAALGIEGKSAEGEALILFAETKWRQVLEPETSKSLVIDITRQIHARFGIRPAKVYLLKAKAIPFTFNGKKQHGLLKKWYLDGNLRREGSILFPHY